MYAGHLAINHYAGRGQINLIQKPHAIDYSCTVNTSFHTEEIIHIHAWHVSDHFLCIEGVCYAFRPMICFRNFYLKTVRMIRSWRRKPFGIRIIHLILSYELPGNRNKCQQKSYIN